MEIRLLSEENGSNSNYDSLVNHLSQIVLSETDEQIKSKSAEFDKLKIQLDKIKNEMIAIKKGSDTLIDEYSKEKLISRILTLVGTLKEEGAIRGNNKVQIIKLLNSIEKLNYEELINVEKKLNILR